MKKVFFLLWLSFLLLTTFQVQAKMLTSWPRVVNQYPSKVVTIENTDEWFLLIKPRKTKLVFFGDGITAKGLREVQEASVVINAGYFGYADEVTKRPFVPAWSYPYSIETNPDDVPCSKDRNLCGRIDAQTLKIQTSWSRIEKNVLNAWPMMLELWQVNTAIIWRKSHRLTPNYRTVLINSNAYGNFFFISTQKRTLLEVSMMIQKWFPKATAINLDGWSSTSWSSQNGSYNSSKVLPTYFVLE